MWQGAIILTTKITFNRDKICCSTPFCPGWSIITFKWRWSMLSTVSPEGKKNSRANVQEHSFDTNIIVIVIVIYHCCFNIVLKGEDRLKPTFFTIMWYHGWYTRGLHVLYSNSPSCLPIPFPHYMRHNSCNNGMWHDSYHMYTRLSISEYCTIHSWTGHLYVKGTKDWLTCLYKSSLVLILRNFVTCSSSV